MNISEFSNQLNEWGHTHVPFLFLVDFEMKKPLAFRLDEIKTEELLFNVNGFSNCLVKQQRSKIVNLKKVPESFNTYTDRFNKVRDRLCYGDSFLTNLTIKTRIEINYSLMELFSLAQAKYKLWHNNQFLVFSPETFIQVRDGHIYAYPMKGTIDANIPNASDVILNDVKEKAEHITIVDLLRNDLSMVAKEVRVKRFRYVEKIKTSERDLLQVSSEVAGKLNNDFHQHLGDILVALLPAGSVSGAPKPKTTEIIADAEQEDRGYFTGVFGIYDGNTLDSGVLIRFIEKSGNEYFYRSGGGITARSRADLEYNEAINKIYVPLG